MAGSSSSLAPPPAPPGPPPPEPIPAWQAPARLGAAAVAGTLLLGAVDPSTHHVPLCPLAALTGLDCPACGSLRAVHDLAHLDLAGAFGHNALFVVLAPFLVLAWAAWMARSLGYPALGTRRWPRHTGWALLVVGAVFAVARNLPAFASLGSA